MRKIILLMLFYFYSCNLFAQSKNGEKYLPIHISIILSDAILRHYQSLNMPLELSFYSEFRDRFQNDKRIISLKNNQTDYTIQIKPESNLSYFEFTATMRSVNDNLFLIEQGDSITINYRGLNDVIFSGKGASKLNFQHWAAKYTLIDYTEFSRIRTSNGDQNFISDCKQSTEQKISHTIDSLQKLKLSNEVSVILSTNTINSTQIAFLDVFNRNYNNYDSIIKADFIKELYRQVIPEDSSRMNINTFQYPQRLFAANKALVNILARETNKKVFSLLFERINSQYLGSLRDRLFVLCFQQAWKQNPEAQIFLPLALKIVRDSISVNTLNKIGEAGSPGATAYPFILESLNGTPIKLKDLKGKVVIIDTYYNGCLPCVWLAKKMEPIIEKYKDRDDVVFLNLDALSRDRKSFETGANKGIYGSRHSIYAWVGPIGEHHPMIKFYRYTSYPNLLLIDKQGKIISTNPEKPINDMATTKFLELIQINL